MTSQNATAVVLEEPTEVNMELMTAEAAKMGDLQVVTPDNVMAVAEKAAKAEFKPASAITDEEVAKAMAEIDMSNTNSITRFGAAASEQATAVSRQMLDGVRNKDTGPVGDVMNDMMLTIRGLDPSTLQAKGFLGRFFGSQASRLAKFTQEFESVNGQIESMQHNLEDHQTTLMTSVATMDRLYEATIRQFHELEVYIIAGQKVLEKLNTEDIPALQVIVDAGTDGPDGTPAALMPQEFADLQARRDQMERKVHDLKLTRMVSLQALPKIRLTQDSDNSLIAKIDTIVATTIPIWYQEMALALEVSKTQKAADATNHVADMTEEMLNRGAEQFKTATLDARKSVERGVIGMETVQNVNQILIDTINEAVAITEEGKRNRAAADQALAGTEAALRTALKTTAKSQDTYLTAPNSDGGE